MSAKRASRELPTEVGQRLQYLAARLRIPFICNRVWSLLTSAEQRRVEGDDSIGPDIVDIWRRIKGVSGHRAIVDMACETELILPKEYERLLVGIGERRQRGEGPEGKQPPKPFYKDGVLESNGVVVRRVRQFRKPSRVQIILARFQARGWPRRIRSPFADAVDSQTVYQAVHQLKHNLTEIDFEVQDSGSYIAWIAN